MLLNTAGFYNGLEAQLRRMEDEDFLPLPLTELVSFAEKPEDALVYPEARATAAATGRGTR